MNRHGPDALRRTGESSVRASSDPAHADVVSKPAAEEEEVEICECFDCEVGVEAHTFF